MPDRDDVLDAAHALVEAEGFAALSVRRIAEALGTSRQVVYTHFDGKGGLLDGLHRRASDLLFAAVRATPGPPGTAAHVLATGQTYLDAARDRPRLFELAFSRPVASHEPSSEAVEHARQGFGSVVLVVGSWLAARDGRGLPTAPPWDDPDAVRLARTVWSTTHGHVVLERAGHATPGETDHLVAGALQALLDGWPGPAGRGPS